MKNNETGKLWSGIMFIIVGFILLINEFFPQIDFEDFWPILLIITGLVIIYDGIQKNNNILNTKPNSTTNSKIEKL